MLSSNRSINKKNLISTSPNAHLSSKKLSISSFKLTKTLQVWPEIFEDRKKLFEQYSHGKSYIPPPEIKKMIEKEEIFQGITTEVLRKSLKHGEICANFNSRGVDRKEFPYFLRNLRYFFDLQKAFESLDSDKDNRLKKAEFLQNRAFLNENLGETAAERVFEEMDVDYSGTVSFEEFCNWALRQPEILSYNNKEYFKEIMGSSVKLLANLNESLEEGETLNFNRESSSFKESLLKDLRESVDFLGTKESQDLESSEEMLDLGESPVRKTSFSKELEVKKAEILVLRAEIKQKEEKLVELFKEIEEKNNLLQGTQEKSRLASEEIAELREKLREKQRVLAEVEEIVKEKEGLVQELSEKLKEKEKYLEENRRELGEYKEKIKEIAVLEERNAELSKKTSVIEELFKEIAKEREKVKENEQLLENNRALIAKLRQEIEENAILLQKSEEKIKEHEFLEEELRETRELLGKTARDSQENQREHELLLEKVEEFVRNEGVFKQNIEEKSQTIEKLQENIKNQSISLENLRAEAAEKDHKLSDLHGKLLENESNSTKILKELALLRETLEKSQRNSEEMNKKCVFLEEKLKAQESERCSEKSSFEKLEEMRRMLEIQENTNKEIKEEINKKEKIISELLEKADKGKSSGDSKRCEVCQIF